MRLGLRCVLMLCHILPIFTTNHKAVWKEKLAVCQLSCRALFSSHSFIIYFEVSIIL